jgi:SAM-dependent methyltransferase
LLSSLSKLDSKLDQATFDADQFVELLYRGVLRRSPDERGRAGFVELLRSDTSPLNLLRMFVDSAEFQSAELVLASSVETSEPRFVPLGAAAISVECRASAAQLTELTARISQAWAALGAQQPYHSVITDAAYLPANLNSSSIESFWASGVPEVLELEAVLARHNFRHTKSSDCVEYGCGVGRVTFPLSKLFRTVHAYDISPSHLEIARARAKQLAPENIVFHVATAETILKGIEPCDFFFSRIVFQHNPPPIIAKLISTSLEALRSGGVAIFQVPTYATNYRFQIDEYLAATANTDMELHAIPQPEVFALITEADCRVLEVREDGYIGLLGKWISNTFIVRRN